VLLAAVGQDTAAEQGNRGGAEDVQKRKNEMKPRLVLPAAGDAN